jgi:hypothetical protein
LLGNGEIKAKKTIVSVSLLVIIKNQERVNYFNIYR